MDATNNDPTDKHRSPDTEAIDHCARDIRDTLVKYGMGGLIVVVAPDAAAAFTETPEWSKVQVEALDNHELHLNFDPKTGEEMQHAMHFLTCIAEYCTQFGGLFGTFLMQVKAQLAAMGISMNDVEPESDEVVEFPDLERRHDS